MEKKKVLKWILVFALISVLWSACSKHKSSTLDKTIVAKESPISISLFFPGTLAPISIKPVTAPVDGHVAALRFSYGLPVTKDQELVVIASNRAAENYQKVIGDYLQRKSDYINSSISFAGDKALYKAGVISRENYLSSQSANANSALAFFQARYALEKTLAQLNINPTAILALNISDMAKVQQILNQKFAHIVVKSPTDGIALFPVDNGTSDSEGDKNKKGKLVVGADLKAGQVMLNVGDLTGLQANINVSEVDVNQIKAGMKAILTGDAFPGIKLQGVVASVAAQANPDNSGQGNLAQFSAIIIIPKITEKERAVIRVGMTSKIKIELQQGKKITLPLSAIITKNGQTFVTIINKSGKEEEVPVELGDTTPTGVIVLHGIEPGTEVVQHD